MNSLKLTSSIVANGREFKGYKVFLKKKLPVRKREPEGRGAHRPMRKWKKLWAFVGREKQM